MAAFHRAESKSSPLCEASVSSEGESCTSNNRNRQNDLTMNGGAAHRTLGISTGEVSMMSHFPILIIDAKVKGCVLIILEILQFLHEHKTQKM